MPDTERFSCRTVTSSAGSTLASSALYPSTSNSHSSSLVSCSISTLRISDCSPIAALSNSLLTLRNLQLQQHLLQQRKRLQPAPVTPRYSRRTMPRTRRHKVAQKPPPNYYRYVVRMGRRRGIFHNYDQVRAHVENTNACHMGFFQTDVLQNVHHFYMQCFTDDHQIAKHQLPGGKGAPSFVYEPLPCDYYDCDQHDSYEAWEQSQVAAATLSLLPGPSEDPPPASPNNSSPPPAPRSQKRALPLATEYTDQAGASPSYSPQLTPQPTPQSSPPSSPPKARDLHEGLQPGPGHA